MHFVGIDIGSVASKIAIIDEAEEQVGYCVTDTTPDIDETAQELLDRALAEMNLARFDVAYIVGTGYGRSTISLADENKTEILCHAAGVHRQHPAVRTVIDIGGQDSKVIRLNAAGKVANFAMNNRCAAGTGRFTEVMAKALGIELSRWGEVVRSATRREKISSICTVFAESEIISKIMQKVPLNEILAGVCDSIATRIIETVQRVGGSEPEIAFTGGVANNEGIRLVLEDRLGTSLLIPRIPQSTGAYGAAVLARKAWGKRGGLATSPAV